MTDMPSAIWVQRNKFSSDVPYNAWDTNDTAFCETKYVLGNEADELRRQRDEALQALRSVMQHKDSRLSTNVEYIGVCQKAQRILAQYEDGDA